LPIIKTSPQNPRPEEEVRMKIIESHPQVSSEIFPMQLVTRDLLLQTPKEQGLQHNCICLIVSEMEILDDLLSMRKPRKWNMRNHLLTQHVVVIHYMVIVI
jgi:hypothetical protein